MALRKTEAFEKKWLLKDNDKTKVKDNQGELEDANLSFALGNNKSFPATCLREARFPS